MDVRNRRWNDEEFEKVQKEVLGGWPTGKDVHFEEAIQYHRELIKSDKNLAIQSLNAQKEKRKLIHPRVGVPRLEEQIDMLNFLQENGDVDSFPILADSYTRRGNYKEAEKGLLESEKAGRSMLNGFPVTVHGVHKLRHLMDSVKKPVQIRSNSIDVRLNAEISLAGGATGFISGAICSGMNYNKDVPLDRVIWNWQYIDRLVGNYNAAGIPVLRDVLGVMPSSGVPPSLVHAAIVIESLLAAEQGVKYLAPEWFFNGNMIQDISAMQTISKTCRHYLDHFSYTDVALLPAANHYNGPFPDQLSFAYGLIVFNTVETMFTDAVRVAVKTLDQAHGIPTKESNAAACRATKFITNLLQNQPALRHPDIEIESAMIEKETRAIVDKVITLGRGDIAQGAIRGFEAGIIEAPFAACRFDAGKVMTIRDSSGAVRFLDFGNLPFSEDCKEFHRAKIAEREQKEGREVGYEMIVDSILCLSKGYL